jgi:hypothetical protein
VSAACATKSGRLFFESDRVRTETGQMRTESGKAKALPYVLLIRKTFSRVAANGAPGLKAGLKTALLRAQLLA